MRSGARALPSQPNIVVLIADDHRHDCLSGIGHSQVRTPNMDRLASDGTQFTQAYLQGSTSGAVCMPSRAMLMTGAGLFHVFAPGQSDPSYYPIRDELPLLPELLGRSGYQTHGIGKWHNGREAFARGFGGGARIMFGGMSDHDAVPVHDFDPSGAYPPEDGYEADGFSSEIWADSAVDFIEQRDRERPFFLYVAFTAPHDPRTPPDHWREQYPPDEIELPPNYMTEHPFDTGMLAIRDEVLADHPRREWEVRRHIAEYYGMISHLDECIGRILDALDRESLTEDTIVVYTADHGLSVGQHGLLGKQNLYDHSARIPLIARGPGIGRGRSCESLCYQHDLNPTLLEMAGLDAPDGDFKSLRPAFEDNRAVIHEQIFGNMQLARSRDPDTPHQRMIRRGDYKLIRIAYRGFERWQLFNVVADPDELCDLAGRAEHAALLDDLQKRLALARSAADDPLA